jgi:hypothetical protein
MKIYISIIILTAALITGCASTPVKQNDYFQTLEKSKKSLDKIKHINTETKAKADEYQKDSDY